MPRYIFDVNEGDSSEWNDEDFECGSRADIEQHARRLIEEAGARQAARGSGSLPSTVVVYEEDGEIVMSAHGWATGSVRVLWARGWEPRSCSHSTRRPFRLADLCE
ncbi:DUF6894 family protein [Methylobacterium thuringiense]|uniref:DUF6894 family protein n=1 Tax=Methylobacterium thuringiense TaxID=1003091 RepID=UPI003570F1FC